MTRPCTRIHHGPDGAVSATVLNNDGTVLFAVCHHVAPDTGPGGAAEVAVTGGVDLDTAPLLHKMLLEAVDGSGRVRCDLAGVDFFGAAGAGALLAAHEHAVDAGSVLTVSGVRGITRTVFDIVGLDRVLTCDD